MTDGPLIKGHVAIIDGPPLDDLELAIQAQLDDMGDDADAVADDDADDDAAADDESECQV